MGVRSRVLAASALGLGAFAAMAGPAAADQTFSRTDTFGECDVHSELTLFDSGTIAASTEVVGTGTNCLRPTVTVRVTYVEADGDPREVRAIGRKSVRYSFDAPEATEVSSFHSAYYEICREPSDCQSPEYRLGSK